MAMLLAVASCDGKTENKAKMEPAAAPTVHMVSDEDADMNSAMKTARETLDKFNAALKSKNPKLDNFAIKVRFDAPSGGEHIWVGEVSLKKGKYSGVVGNVPERTTDVKLGDTIEIVNDNISDWMYLEGGKLHGGYTIRVLRKRMPDAERKQFDQDSGLIIED